MKYKVLILVFLIGTLISCKGNDSKENRSTAIAKISETKTNLLGIWNWRSKDNSQEFTLKILETPKDSLLAQYCAVYNNRQKLDCDFENNINVKLAFDKDKNAYIGEFFSFFNSGKGKCLVRKEGNSLMWQILEIPEGEYYAPEKCFLEKKIDTQVTTNHLKEISTIFPLDYKSLTEKIKLEVSVDDNILKLFKQKYQLGIDAMSKLPSNGNYDLYIINNSSGDSEIMYLITIKADKLIDGLEVANSNGDEELTKEFSVDGNYKITIYTVKNDKREIYETYSLNHKGLFLKTKIKF